MKWLFREKFKVNEDKSKTDLPQLSNKQKCRKWDKRIASWFGLFAFFTLVGFVIYNALHANKPCSGCGLSWNTDTKTYASKGCTKKSGYPCSFKCDNINEEKQSIADYLNEVLENEENCQTAINLDVNNAKFKQSKLTTLTFANITPNIEDLVIHKCTLDEITENAFAHHPFGKLYRLRFVNANVQVLRRHSFLGLNTLSDFSFANYNNLRTLTIEEGVLESMRGSLETLEISRYILSADDILNLTGKKLSFSLTKLQTLVLAYNSIPELKEYSFSKATRIVKLFLQESALERIDEKAFHGPNSFKLLNLSENFLETLSQGTFINLETDNGGIDLYGKYWQCNCSLEWLQDYYINTEYINKTTPPICFEQEEKKFEDVDFCPNSPPTSTTTKVPPSITTTTEVSHSLSTPKPTTEVPPEYITVKCQDQKMSPSHANVDITHSVEVVINNKNLKLHFLELEGNPLQVEMRTTEDLTDYHLLWFNADYKNETNCTSPVEDGTLLTDLKRNTTYSFSLLYAGETEVSPKCTFCIKTEPEWKYRSWIKNKYKISVIVVTIIILIILICLAILITFLCIRRHPKLIQGNKNVIIIKPKKNSVEEVLPREYEKPAYWEPYLVPSSHGYLTPKFQRYAKVRYRPPLMRSISEWSVTSTSDPYNYDDPRHLQAMQMLRSLKQNPNKIIEADVYDYRPPLPPPNPGTKRPSAPIHEELYSSV